MIIAKALGVDLVKGGGRENAPERIELDPARPTLADLAAAIPMPVPGGDTTAVSAAILEKLKGLT